MLIVISFIVGGAIGFGIGFLVYRNNAKKLGDLEMKVKDLRG